MLGSTDSWDLAALKRRSLAARRFAAAAICAAALLAFTCTSAAAQSAPQFVYTADEATQSISAFQLNPTNGALTPVSGSPFKERLDPTQLAVNPAGTLLFVANYADNDVSVFQINPASGALTEIPQSPFSAGNGTGPAQLATDASGKFLYVANDVSIDDPNSGEIDVYEIDATTGALTPSPNTQTGPPTFCPINPVGIFAHPNGKWLYVSGGLNLDVPSFDGTLQGYTIDSETGDLLTISNPYEFSWPRALAANTSFLFSNWGEILGSIDAIRISPIDGSLTYLQTSYENTDPGATDIPEAVDSTGNFLVTFDGVFQIDQSTGALTFLQPYSDPEPDGGAINLTASRISPYLFAGHNQASVIDSYQLNAVTGALTLAPGSPFQTSAPVQSIAVTGYAAPTPAPGAYFSPIGLDFANTFVGQNSVLPIALYSTGTLPLDISGITITGADASSFSQTNNCPSSLAAGANCTITVTFTPSAAGPLSASLSVSDNAAGSPQSATLTGTGVTPAPAASLTPASYTFAATDIGSTSTAENFTLANTGSAALHISSLALDGPNPGDFSEANNCGQSVTAGSSCTISVKFQPQADGERTASVTIADNAAGSPQSISFSGTGDGPPFSVAPAAQGGASATTSSTGSASYSLQFTSTANFNGMVAIACAGAPANSVCSASPASFQSSGTATVPFTVTVSPMPNSMTNPMTSAFAAPAPNQPFAKIAPPAATRFVAFMMAILAALGLLLFTSAKRATEPTRFRFANVVALSAALALMLLASACGGVNSSSNQPASGSSGIQPGQYTLTLTASSGGVSQNLSLTLNITTPQ